MSKEALDVQSLKSDFSILKRKVHSKPLVYLDNGATSLTPDVVVKEMDRYYLEYNANIHRGVHALSEEATREYEDAHRKVARFINAGEEEIVFTKGATESLNLLAYSLSRKLKPGDEVVISEMEHHANIVPWQQWAKEKGFTLKFIQVNDEGFLDVESVKKSITKKTRIVSVVHVSNVLGTVNEVKSLGVLAHAVGALMIVDGAQSVPHMPVDVKDLDCDFLCFSGHKMCGPTGIGVLYGKKHLLESMVPFNYGGDMISSVDWYESSWNDVPWKFEAGTPNISGGIGLGKAAEYLMSIGMENIREYEERMMEYALEKISAIKGVKVFGPRDAKKRSGVISFTVNEVHAHDVASLLDREGIAIRAGHMCAMPLVTKRLGVNSVNRASWYFYNTREDVDKVVDAIEKVKEVFRVR